MKKWSTLLMVFLSILPLVVLVSCQPKKKSLRQIGVADSQYFFTPNGVIQGMNSPITDEPMFIFHK